MVISLGWARECRARTDGVKAKEDMRHEAQNDASPALSMNLGVRLTGFPGA